MLNYGAGVVLAVRADEEAYLAKLIRCSLLVALVWTGLFATRRYELRRILLWPAMVLATVSSSTGIYGLIHMGTLQQRQFFDYGFERRASKVALLALMAAVAWLVRTRIFIRGSFSRRVLP